MSNRLEMFDTSHLEISRLKHWNAAVAVLSLRMARFWSEIIISVDSLPERSPIVRDQPGWDLLCVGLHSTCSLTFKLFPMFGCSCCRVVFFIYLIDRLCPVNLLRAVVRKTFLNSIRIETPQNFRKFCEGTSAPRPFRLTWCLVNLNNSMLRSIRAWPNGHALPLK